MHLHLGFFPVIMGRDNGKRKKKKKKSCFFPTAAEIIVYAGSYIFFSCMLIRMFECSCTGHISLPS